MTTFISCLFLSLLGLNRASPYAQHGMSLLIKCISLMLLQRFRFRFYSLLRFLFKPKTEFANNITKLNFIEDIFFESISKLVSVFVSDWTFILRELIYCRTTTGTLYSFLNLSMPSTDSFLIHTNSAL